MQMRLQLLTPRMQDGKETDLGFQVLPSGGLLGERLGGSEQEIGDHHLVL